MRKLLLVTLLLMSSCKGEVGDICENASDCAGEMCLALSVSKIRQCTQECPCGEGEKCEGGAFCIASCSEADPSCPEGLVCYANNGECLPPCETDADCDLGFVCTDSMCI